MSAEEILADLRHRLRTPLNHIIGYSELLLEDAGGFDSDSAAQLRTIRANAHLILSQIQHRLSPDEDHAPEEKIAGLRSDIAEPLDMIIGNAGRLSQRLRGPDLLDLLRINAASMDLFWFAQGNDIAGRVFAAPHRPPQPGPAVVFAHPSRILIVDDDETNCDVLSRQLARGGHTVTCVSSGAAAMKVIRDESFDLVLLDVVMAGFSGFDVLRELKGDPALRAIPVIMMSALDELESAAHCIQMGAEDYLLKPVDPVLLRARLHSALERKRLHEDLHRFAFAASHDLQEPLRMIISFMSMIELKYNSLLDENGKKYIHFAVDGGKRMRQIILDLLSYSRAGHLSEKIEAVNLTDLMDEMQALFRKPLRERQAQITYPNLPVLYTYKAPIRQILQNLVGNALKYQEPGKIPCVTVTSEELPEHWRFSVSDNGIGIEPGDFERIFVIFQRLHGKSAYPGTGLGLAITKKIIENLGGQIKVESEKGKGSTFIFTIAKINASEYESLILAPGRGERGLRMVSDIVA